jgi:PncC family amidohydrolase
MERLFALAQPLSMRLIERRETVAVAEGSAGGLISAALLAVPGASAYFLGGAVIYTAASRAGLLGIDPRDLADMRPATEPYALFLADRLRTKHGAVWGIAETGAAGPTGNRYGDPAGHTCLAVAGPQTASLTFRAGSADRRANMGAFAEQALALLAQMLAEA